MDGSQELRKKVQVLSSIFINTDISPVFQFSIGGVGTKLVVFFVIALVLMQSIAWAEGFNLDSELTNRKSAGEVRNNPYKYTDIDGNALPISVIS